MSSPEERANGYLQRPLHLDTSLLTPTSQLPYSDHSPALSMKIRVPKRQYSTDDPLQRMETPMFEKKTVIKKGPSSPGTVLTMAGLFVVGIMLIISGLLVLILQRETAFLITGCVFVGTGLAMQFVCLLLQWKNLVKFVRDLNKDLYFLNMSESTVGGVITALNATD